MRAAACGSRPTSTTMTALAVSCCCAHSPLYTSYLLPAGSFIAADLPALTANPEGLLELCLLKNHFLHVCLRRARFLLLPHISLLPAHLLCPCRPGCHLFCEDRGHRCRGGGYYKLDAHILWPEVGAWCTLPSLTCFNSHLGFGTPTQGGRTYLL